MKQNKTLLFTLFFMLSCGGGGGGGSAPAPVISQTPTPPVAPPTLSYDELKAQYEGYYEYQGQWGLDVVNASAAYARGATGLGITIGITDSGLDNTHTEISAGRLSGDSDLSYSNYTPNTRQQRHGTMVASVAAGKQEKSDTSPMHGVAFEANVLFIAIQLAEPDPDYDPVDLGTDDGSGNVTGAPDFTGIDNFFSSLFEVYNQYDVDIVNNSYGYSGNIIDYTEAQVRNAFPKTIAEMSQIGTPDSQKTIYVWAAGNAGGYADQGVDFSSPELLPGMAHYIPEIQGHSIAVASIGNSPGTSNNEGMINSITDIQSSAYGMGFLKQSIFNSGDELLLSIDQPMRTESGEMNLRVPVYRTKERNVLFNSFGFTLRPSGREVHSKARYMSSYKNIGLSLTLGYKSDPYHIKSLEDYWYTALGFSIKI